MWPGRTESSENQMRSSAFSGVSDEWLITFVYEQGKAGGTDHGTDSDFLLRLAEARAGLRRGSRAPRRMIAETERETETIELEADREGA